MSQPRPIESTASETALSQLSRVCDEAVEMYGPDWPRVSAYISNWLSGLPPAERGELEFAAGALFTGEPGGVRH